jgi:putative nucleotidyltransferase with HDIG domain
MYRRKLTESAAMRNDTIKLILRILAQKYPREEQHSKRVSKLCAEIAEAMGMNPDSVSELRLAGYMHNIGYIGLREELVNRIGSYTDTERAEMERHPEIGYQLLRSAGKYSSIADFILFHHERYDGKGYPSRAAADDIPVESRIIAVADAFDSMTNDRLYGEKMTPGEALNEIRRNAGTQFDDEIVNHIIKIMN